MPAPDDFLTRLTQIIEENLSNEHFGVSELANEVAMSRSNLLRKVKKETGLSASQFIRQVRLRNAMEMLKQSTSTVSEISYEVGFSSVSYFIKCFGDFYGYSPGEAGKHEVLEEEPVNEVIEVKKKYKPLFIGAGITAGIIILFFVFFNPFKAEPRQLEKSIAVLPFINDSDDSTNVYIINGLMESILNNLQKIGDLKVISRTSVEKYRNTDKTIPEIAKELNVSYFVEGSGQKIGNKLLLNVQLIEAQSDKHLWAEQYDEEAKDIFEVQKTVAKSIARKVHAIITPAEELQIDKKPTENLEAYDNFLKAKDLMNKGNFESLEQALPYLEKAIEKDPNFARAYSAIAIAYYYLDILRIEKKYTKEINNYADKALLVDPQLPQGLLAKGLFYIHIKDYQQAATYLEKALSYEPNSAMIINILSDFYTTYIPNTQKYLEYALRGARLNIAANDSTTASFIFLHISNAFVQTGFVTQAETYVNKSLEYNPDNIFSQYVKAYILYAKNRDLKKTRDLLIQVLKKDTTRLDVMQEVGKVCYYLRDYETAYKYFKKFTEIRESQKLDIFRHMNAEIGFVYEKMGFKEKANYYFDDFKVQAENNNSLYKDLELCMYYSHMGETQKALHHLELFSKQTDYHYWTILFVQMDPLLDNLKDLPEFKKLSKKIENKFWENHEDIKTSLEGKGLI
jgi:TolB-like protein/AraC-like DNA-binding protein/Tfp pilus assembly protein PilF